MFDKIILGFSVTLFIYTLKLSAIVFGVFIHLDVILTGLLAYFLVNYLSRE